MADPDFLSLVDTNRFQPALKSVTSPTARARLQQKKKAYWNENISLRLVPPPSISTLPLDNESGTSSQSATGTWNIPRFRLTESFLQEIVNRGKLPSSPMLIVSHLQKSNVVILPNDDMQAQCRASPVIYDVIVHSAGGIKRGGVLSGAGDSYYDGDLIFVIQNIPEASKSGRFEVMSTDVHRWLVNGAISGVEKMQIHTDKIRNLKQTLKQLDGDMKKIHVTPIYHDNGRAIVGSPLKDAREAKFSFLQDEKEQTKSRLVKAELSLEAARERHFSACSLQITERSELGQNTKNGSNKTSFSVKVIGKKKDYYTNLITNKTDWCSVQMYATGDRTVVSKSKHRHRGNKSAIAVTIGEADQAEHFVDVGAVSIEMLPDGFGVHEAYNENDPFATSENVEDGSARGQHRLFHGHFREGEYYEGTLHTEAGMLSGKFVSSEPRQGKMKYADGVVLTGDFALPPENKGAGERAEEEPNNESPLGPNPYRRGLPHNNVHIQFKDGASYEGKMQHGGITGNGIFRYPYRDGDNEIKENFVNGMIQNNDGVEGQGGSNFLRSLRFNSERLWGPPC